MSATASWVPQGTVYGTLLNFRREYEWWTPRMNEVPYKAPPQAPVLYIKTANTFATNGAAVPVPGEVEVGATLGMVIPDNREDGIPSLVLLNDLSLPHASYYRPPVRFRNRDGFLVCGPEVRPMNETGSLSALTLEVRINDALVQSVELSGLRREAATLLADVNEFMSLLPGDVLMLGTDCLADGTRPRARPGDRVEIRAHGFAPLAHSLVAEDA